jgi:hypothetical protein
MEFPRKLWNEPNKIWDSMGCGVGGREMSYVVFMKLAKAERIPERLGQLHFFHLVYGFTSPGQEKNRQASKTLIHDSIPSSQPRQDMRTPGLGEGSLGNDMS